MNILELDSFNLADAVKFNDQLNPRIWDGNKMRPEVRAKLMEIAEDFREFLGVDNLNVKDITVSGSNASYHYTPYSDIDLHLVVDVPQLNDDTIFRELFDAKKYQYNDLHNIKIGGYDVELYVEDAGKPPVSQGIFSVLNDDWINIPKKRRATVDDTSVKSKYEDIKHRIESAVKDQDFDRIDTLARKIKAYRQAGLAKHGEFGPENIAYKMLRNQGYIGKLYDARNAARDAELSLTERKKKKKKVKYGFTTGWAPAFDASNGVDVGDGGMAEDVTLTPDGVSASTKMFLSEKDAPSREEIVSDFMNFVVQELDLQNVPTLKIKKDPQWSVIHKTFGRYRDDLKQIELAVGDRHIMDVLRTLAHELQHRKQDEREGMPPGAGETGSKFENEANAVAGILMRKYAEMHPEYFEDAQVSESASGYIPTKKQANDPRYKMALTVDIKPGEVGRQANKMALKTDAQGRPALLMKTANLVEGQVYNIAPNQLIDVFYNPGRIDNTANAVKVATVPYQNLDKLIALLGQKHKIKPTQIFWRPVKKVKPQELDEDLVESLRSEFALLESEIIGEIRMTPSNLRQEAAKTGAIAGMEFEMIIPNLGNDEFEPEYENDYDQDRRARSFDDVEEFFYDGDYNSRGDVRRLLGALGEAYQEWKMEQIADDWNNEGVDFLRDYIANNDLFDRDDALDTARDEVINANPDLPTDSEEFQQLVNARINELEEQFVLDEFDDRGRIYDRAFEEFADDKNEDYEESIFFRDNYPYMSDIQTGFDIQWPYYYVTNDDDRNVNIGQIAEEFSEVIGKPVNYSQNYHGVDREPGKYVVEPDNSLQGDDDDDSGLEFVSPPMPLEELLGDLNKVREWAGRIGAYTNQSTGLHINISVPNYSVDQLDYVKLAVLMGDERVLNEFGRMGNTYTKSALGKIKNILKTNPNLAPQLMDKMRGHMEDLATKAIHSGKTDKYTSINTKDGYIEFRSPGGDWLDENFDKIESTMMRFVVAMDAALDPEKYRQEYLKKLYKLLETSKQDDDLDVIKLFSNYSAGELDKPELIKKVRQQQLSRKLQKNVEPGKQYWWNVQWDANRRMEVVAGSKEVALQVAAEEWGVPESALAGAKVTVLRPYDATTQQKSAPTVGGRPSNPDGNYVIIGRNSQARNTPAYRFMAAHAYDADTVLLQWSREHPGEWQVRHDPDQELGQPGVPATQSPQAPGNLPVWYVSIIGRPGSEVQVRANSSEEATSQALKMRPDIFGNEAGNIRASTVPVRQTNQATTQQGSDPGSLIDQGIAASGRFTGNWLIQDPNGRTLHRFGGIGNSQSDANNFAMRWLRSNPQYIYTGVEVVPEMN